MTILLSENFSITGVLQKIRPFIQAVTILSNISLIYPKEGKDMSIRILPVQTSNANAGIDFSRFYSIEKDNVFPHFSIKYVHSGIEYYKTENSDYRLGKGEILMAPKQNGKVTIDTTEETIGMCICIDEKTVSDAFRVRTACFFTDPDEIFFGFDNHIPFFERKTSTNAVNFGRQLFSLCEELTKGKEAMELHEEWFLDIANEIALQEIPNIQSYYQLPYSKTATKKEILKRVLTARNYMDDEFLSIGSVDEIAKVALLSKFHFFRAFKLAFNITPHQYLINKRLEYAKQLIQLDKPLSEVASDVKFNDQFSFSKAFKKKFGSAPSLFKS